MSFTTRLLWCKEHGDMTVSDLSVWFGRPRATVNTWVNGRIPYGPAGRLAAAHLTLLENAIRKNKSLPVPIDLSWTKRADYIRGVRDAIERNYRVPQMRSAI